MDRETREFVTPSGKKVVLKTWLTARESLGMMNPEQSNLDRANELARVAIVSIEGIAENISDRLLDMALPDYTAVLTELKTVAEGFQSAK